MINKINKLPKSEFIKVYANIFESSFWIAQKLYKLKPFSSQNDLSTKMLGIFENATKKQQLKILRDHPDLADKTKVKSLTKDSKKEQNSAGLDKCTEKEFNEFRKLNFEYKKKFGFPFILAVKDKNKNEILNNFRKRVSSNSQIEFVEALRQVKKLPVYA